MKVKDFEFIHLVTGHGHCNSFSDVSATFGRKYEM